MLTRGEARDVALDLIRRNSVVGVEILEERTLERPFGWVFFYEADEWLRTGNPQKRLLGNAPVLVDRNTGRGLFTGTAYEVDDYIEAYEVLGPHRYTAEVLGYLSKKHQQG